MKLQGRIRRELETQQNATTKNMIRGSYELSNKKS